MAEKLATKLDEIMGDVTEVSGVHKNSSGLAGG